jgi:UDP-2,3-diacylglucosamine pyrophosphatase LpxH
MGKKIAAYVFTLFSLLPAAAVLWISSQKRNLHMFSWNPTYTYGFLILIGISAVLLLLTVLSISRALNRGRIIGIVGIIAVILSIVITAGLFAYLTPFEKASDKPPYVILTDHIGSRGLPVPAVTWYTEDRQQSSLSYGPNPSELSFIIEEPVPVRSHLFPIEQLRPGDPWYWSIEGSDEIHEVPWFSEYEEGNITIALSSDSHIGAGTNNPEATKRILEAASSSPHDLFFHLGDVVEMGNQDEEYTAYLESASPYLKSIASVHLMGNHDGWFSGLRYFQKFFEPYTPESSDTPLYHRWDLGEDIHIIALNLEWGIETYTQRQRRWLQQTLSQIPEDHLIIILSHAFFYASSTEYEGLPWYDNQEMISTFADLFRTSGVDLVFSGHDHQMEHIYADGIDYVIIGAFGGKPDLTPTFISEGSQFLQFGTFGYARLSIEEQGFTVGFIDEYGTELYRFSRENTLP